MRTNLIECVALVVVLSLLSLWGLKVLLILFGVEFEQWEEVPQ